MTPDLNVCVEGNVQVRGKEFEWWWWEVQDMMVGEEEGGCVEGVEGKVLKGGGGEWQGCWWRE